MLQRQRLEGRVAFVTGAGGGLGRAICRRLADDGAAIAALDINATSLHETVQDLKASGASAHAIVADLTNWSVVHSAVAEAISVLGPFDIAVNNAGIGGDMLPLDRYPNETWDRVIAVNLTSIFYCLKAEVTHMVESRRGSIINIASIMGTVGMASISPYVASKHGVVGLTKSAALEYGPSGVRINAVSPSFVRVGFTAAALTTNEAWDGIAQQHALRGLCLPTDIASMIAFMASDDARFITGADYCIDGGFTAA